jgi:large conductance mechanosensitive channel
MYNLSMEKITKIRGLSGFKQFLSNQGIGTLAIGFILGTAISKFVSSLVTDIINPIINEALGGVENLSSKVFKIGESTIHYGTFINNGIDFLVIALVVYVGVKVLRMDQSNIDKIDIGKINSLNTTKK